MSNHKTIHDSVLFYISRRNSAALVRTQCYAFFQELEAAFYYLDVEPYWDGGHVISKIGVRFYDWTGEVVDNLPSFIPLTDRDEIGRLEEAIHEFNKDQLKEICNLLNQGCG